MAPPRGAHRAPRGALLREKTAPPEKARAPRKPSPPTHIHMYMVCTTIHLLPPRPRRKEKGHRSVHRIKVKTKEPTSSRGYDCRGRAAIAARHSMCTTARRSLDAELRAAPVPAVLVVLDLAVRLEAEPVRQRTVLLHLLRERALRAEGLLGRLWIGREGKCVSNSVLPRLRHKQSDSGSPPPAGAGAPVVRGRNRPATPRRPSPEHASRPAHPARSSSEGARGRPAASGAAAGRPLRAGDASGASAAGARSAPFRPGRPPARRRTPRPCPEAAPRACVPSSRLADAPSAARLRSAPTRPRALAPARPTRALVRPPVRSREDRSLAVLAAARCPLPATYHFYVCVCRTASDGAGLRAAIDRSRGDAGHAPTGTRGPRTAIGRADGCGIAR